jgi:fatty acid desaturase
VAAVPVPAHRPRRSPTGDAELRAFYLLQGEVRERGFEKPTPLPALTALLFHIVLMVTGIWVFAASDPVFIKFAALLVATCGAVGIGTSAHNASHSLVTGNRTFDRALTFLTMTVLSGVSEGFWRYKHIRLHHAGPNNIGIDGDIDLKPFFVLSREDAGRARGWWRAYYRVQHWVFPFAISLNLFNLQREGMLFLARRLRERRGAEDWADCACLACHLALFLGLPLLYWPAVDAIAFFFVREALNGYAMFIVLAPAHFPAEAKLVRGQTAERDLVARQLYTTVNFRTGFWGRLLCLGSEYQIEHHLLPTVNPLKSRQVSPFVEAFCRQNGYPYHCLGWGEAVVKSLGAVRSLKPVYEIKDLRARA